MLLMRDFIKRNARNIPNQTAYWCGENGITWKEIDARSTRLARALQNLGVTKGMAVASFSIEAIPIYELIYACAKIGAVRVGLNTLYTPADALYVIDNSDIRFILVDARVSDQMAALREAVRARGITLIGYNGDHDYAFDYETVMAEADADFAPPELSPADPALHSYTSGTTGNPKGAILTQAGVANVILHSNISFGFSRDDVWYCPGSSAWAVVLMNLFNLGNGMASVIPDGIFQIGSYLDDVEKRGVTVALLVPTMITRAIEEQHARPRDLGSLRLLVYGSSPATPRLIADAREAFGVAMMQCYGQTETTGGWVSVLTEADHKLALASRPDLLRSVGRIGTHYDCSIRDDEGREVPVGSQGEIWLRGNTLMSGYLNLPDATREVLKGDWLRTNDIGRLDADGYLYLLDRQNAMIITGAVNVYPSYIEAALIEHPDIAEVAVVGVPHPEWGEAVVALIVPQENVEVDPAELKRFCKQHLTNAEVPKAFLVRVELPKTYTGKVRKHDLKNHVLDHPELLSWDPSTAVESKSAA